MHCSREYIFFSVFLFYISHYVTRFSFFKWYTCLNKWFYKRKGTQLQYSSLTLRQEVSSVCVIGKRGGDSTTPLSFSQFSCDVLGYITWDLRRIKIHHSQIFLWKVGLKIFTSFLDKRCFMEVIPVKNTYSSKIILITKEEKIDKSYYKRDFPCFLYKI